MTSHVVEMDQLIPDEGPFTHEQATSQFLKTTRNILEKYKMERNQTTSADWTSYLFKGQVLLSIFFTILLFCGILFDHPDSVWEGSWIVLVLLSNGILHGRQQRLAKIEIHSRLTDFVNKVEKYGIKDEVSNC